MPKKQKILMPFALLPYTSLPYQLANLCLKKDLPTFTLKIY
jgi:hypothetical protein